MIRVFVAGATGAIGKQLVPRLERSDGKDVWLDPDNGFMYPQAVAVAMVREGKEVDVPNDPEGTA